MQELTPPIKRFILHWGELGARWGINRTVAQIHALLYVSPQPLPADQIASLLSVARSNVSTSLRELQGWNVIRVVHVMGDRRDHFETLNDVWEMFNVILDERKRREVDPTHAVLKECATEMARTLPKEDYSRQRIHDMLTFFNETTSLYDELKRLPANTLRQLIQMKGQLKRLLGAA